MVGIKNNRRTQYTVSTIKEAFLKLLETQPLTKITVTQICQVANVNRGTFYLHFKDPQDLFNQIENDLIIEVQPIMAIQPKENLPEWLGRFVLFLKEHEQAAKIVLLDYENSQLTQVIFSEVHDMALQEFSLLFDEENPVLLEYYFTYFVKGTVGILMEWLAHDKSTTLAEITGVLLKLFANLSPKINSSLL
jgi:AcrR family transcriptional regulator